jgi:hypothetical protein
MRKRIRELEKRGYTIEITGGGHYRVSYPGKEFVVFSKSPKRVPALDQMLRQIERRQGG